jgi:hypothetical protein
MPLGAGKPGRADASFLRNNRQHGRSCSAGKTMTELSRLQGTVLCISSKKMPRHPLAAPEHGMGKDYDIWMRFAARLRRT